MSMCESCGASALSDAQFCEACGHRLGTPDLRKLPPETSSVSAEAKPGSLRGEVAFLSGAVDQAKVRIDNWKNRGSEKTKIEAERKAVQKREEREEMRAAVRSPLARISRFVVGLSAMLLFVYLLTRMPRGQMSAVMILQLYKEMAKEYGWPDGPAQDTGPGWSILRF
jgi:hypothetical protein